MKETLYIETMNGNKSYYEVEVISKNDEKKEVIIQDWNGTKTLRLDEKTKAYINIS